MKKTLLFVIGLIISFVLAINLLGTRSDMLAGITGNKIKQIQAGWTLEKVIATLGRPYKINSGHGAHKISCVKDKPRLEMDVNNETDIRQVVNNFYNDTNYCCEGNKDDLRNKRVTLTYTRPVILSKYYPMLWIHFDSSFKVSSVYAKQYDGFWGVDDSGIYGTGLEFDTLTGENKTGTFIDEPKFNDCFK